MVSHVIVFTNFTYLSGKFSSKFAFMKKHLISFPIFSAILLTLFSANLFAAPQYPFPQNRAAPYGTTITYAQTDSILSHFNAWKSAWYVDMNDGTARVISPNDSTEMTVSEGIAYGMLMMVYMSSATNDYQSEFDKLWAYWKKYSIESTPSGMHWHINNNSQSVTGSGSATDADLDAALALIMASAQWNNQTYLSEAKTLISWIKSNDMESDGRVRAGSNWNPALNASYVHPATMKLFADVTGESFWTTAITTNLSHISQCQNSTSGLMPDWCTWDSHEVTNNTGAAVSGGSDGFFDDAARTPWRMAWGYYWYGISGAKAINDAIVDWLYRSTYGYAGLIMPGYYMDGSDSPYAMFVSSTFAGGLGLAMASADNPRNYLETVYDVLVNVEGRNAPDASKGEKYYAATLNILYLLLMSGNMPNLYNISQFKAFAATEERMPTAPEGTLLLKNSGNELSGLTNWGTYCDSIGSTMYPASESSGLYLLADGSYAIQMNFRIISEPTYEANVDLDYPYAGVAVSFDKAESYHDLSSLGKIRLTYKSDGVIRMAILDSMTLADGNEGGEPGFTLFPSDKDTTIEISLSESDYSKNFSVPSWTGGGNSRSDVLKAVRGLKFEGKMQKGGYGSLVLKALEMYDAAGNRISNIMTSIENAAVRPSGLSLEMHGNFVVYSGLSNRSTLQIFDLNGNMVKALSLSGSGSFDSSELLQTKGAYILQLKDRNHVKTLRILR